MLLTQLGLSDTHRKTLSLQGRDIRRKKLFSPLLFYVLPDD